MQFMKLSTELDINLDDLSKKNKIGSEVKKKGKTFLQEKTIDTETKNSPWHIRKLFQKRQNIENKSHLQKPKR